MNWSPTVLGERQPLAAIAKQLMTMLPRPLLPRHLEFLDDFPVNANRKIDRKALTARAAALVGTS